MPIKFANITIPGIVLSHFPDRPALLTREVPRWGVPVLEIITSPVGSRPIEVTILVHDHFGTDARLWQLMDVLDGSVGTGGELTITTPKLTRRFPSCIFHGAVPERSDRAGPVQDVAGTLDGGWWMILQCTWLQTRQRVPNRYIRTLP